MTGSFFEPRDESDTQYILARLRSRFEQTSFWNVLLIVAFMLLGHSVGGALGSAMDKALSALISLASLEGFGASLAGVVRLALPLAVMLAAMISLVRKPYVMTLPDALLLMPVVMLLNAATDIENVAGALPASSLGMYSTILDVVLAASVLFLIIDALRRRRLRKSLTSE